MEVRDETESYYAGDTPGGVGTSPLVGTDAMNKMTMSILAAFNDEKNQHNLDEVTAARDSLVLRTYLAKS